MIASDVPPLVTETTKVGYTCMVGLAKKLQLVTKN